MKVIRNAIISAACVLVLVAGALAQQAQSKETDEKAPIAGGSKIGVTVPETELVTPGWRASKLLHTSVRNDANAKIGTIDDLIISPDGTLSVVIVDVGSFIGISSPARVGVPMSSRKVAIPVRQFKKLGAGQAVVPGATKEELKNLPEFKYTE